MPSRDFPNFWATCCQDKRWLVREGYFKGSCNNNVLPIKSGVSQWKKYWIEENSGKTWLSFLPIEWTHWRESILSYTQASAPSRQGKSHLAMCAHGAVFMTSVLCEWRHVWTQRASLSVEVSRALGRGGQGGKLQVRPMPVPYNDFRPLLPNWETGNGCRSPIWTQTKLCDE